MMKHFRITFDGEEEDLKELDGELVLDIVEEGMEIFRHGEIDIEVQKLVEEEDGSKR